MNSFERYMGMVRGRRVDFVPRIPILMHFAVYYHGVKYSDFASDERVLVEANRHCAEDFGFDQLDVMCDPYRETSDFGAELVYRDESVPVCVRHPLADDPDLEKLPAPSPYQPGRMNQTVRAVALYRQLAWQEHSITGWVEGPAAEAADLRGEGNFLLDLMAEPEYAADLMDLVVDNAIEYAKAQIEAGADTIGVGDAIASQISARTYEELVLPREQRLFRAIHDAGGLVRLHICGNTNHLLPLIAESGADILDCDSAVDMKRARALMPKVVLTGNLNPVGAILNGTPASIRDGFRRLYEEVGNPFFVNAGCEVPGTTPHENLRALCEPMEWRE